MSILEATEEPPYGYCHECGTPLRQDGVCENGDCFVDRKEEALRAIVALMSGERGRAEAYSEVYGVETEGLRHDSFLMNCMVWARRIAINALGEPTPLEEL